MGGLFGVATKDNCSKLVLFGTDYHSHLKTNWGGVGILTPDNVIERQRKTIEDRIFRTEFSQIKSTLGHYGIGVMSDERQPISKLSRHGDVAVATDATILNLNEVKNYLLERHVHLTETRKLNNTEIIWELIHQKKSIVEGIEFAMNKIKGCCTLLLVNSSGIYAARDKNGLNSLVIGRRESDGALAVATETCSFPNLEFKIEKFMRPGEIVHLSDSNYETLKILEGARLKRCIFDYIYFSFPASDHDGQNVEIVRNRCGNIAGKKFRFEDADYVCGVPDSGLGHAVGFAETSGVPYKRPLLKYTDTYVRSYLRSSQKKREEVAWGKIIPNPSLIKDAVMVILDDSLRRGTQMKRLLDEKVKPYAPKAVHVLFMSPPQVYPCVRTPMDANLLIARKAVYALEGREDITDFSEYTHPNTEKHQKLCSYVARALGADSCGFLSLDDMCEASGLKKENYCLHCWAGEFGKNNHNLDGWMN